MGGTNPENIFPIINLFVHLYSMRRAILSPQVAISLPKKPHFEEEEEIGAALRGVGPEWYGCYGSLPLPNLGLDPSTGKNCWT